MWVERRTLSTIKLMDLCREHNWLDSGNYFDLIDALAFKHYLEPTDIINVATYICAHTSTKNLKEHEDIAEVAAEIANCCKFHYVFKEGEEDEIFPFA